MTTATIRQKLYEYIRVAPDKKVKALFTIIENDVHKLTNWCDQQDVITELEKRSTDLKSGEDKGVTWDNVKKQIFLLKKD